MDSNIDELISESNNNNKPINDIPKELKFVSNSNISRKKYKPIPVTSSDVRKGKKTWAVQDVGL